MIPAQTVGIWEKLGLRAPKENKKRLNIKEEEGQMIFQPPTSSNNCSRQTLASATLKS
jgi:hypothetical protein